jgi:hypothetical protein
MVCKPVLYAGILSRHDLLATPPDTELCLEGAGHIIMTQVNQLSVTKKLWSLTNAGFDPRTFQAPTQFANLLHYLKPLGHK